MNISDLKFAVLITTYNSSATIQNTIKKVIESIVNSNIEIIVYIFDNCSTDNTLEIAKENWSLSENNLKIIINEKNLGLFGNKNAGLKYLYNMYDWVLLMHSDDLPNATWIERIVYTISTSSEINKTFVIWSSYDNFIIHTNTFIEDGDKRNGTEIIYPVLKNVENYICKIHTPFCISGSAINLKLCNQINYFDEKFHHFGDTDFIVKGLLEGFNHVYIQKALITRTVGMHQASSRNYITATDIKEYYSFYKKYCIYLKLKAKIWFSVFLLKNVSKRVIKCILKLNIKQLFSVLKIGTQLSFEILISFFRKRINITK